ncbi:MAG: phosphorothioated DNA-binding restriction endonuclease [Thermodesulfobacteriota bacterium]
MNKTEIKNRIANLNVYKRGGVRAPHKHLLLLYSIARLLQTGQRLVPYSEIDQNLRKLLIEFGPKRVNYHPQYSFWRLQEDGLWEVDKPHKVALTSSGDARRTDLITHNVSGGLPQDVFHHFISDKKFVSDVVFRILDTSFPSSIHEDILQAVGLDIGNISFKTKFRDPNFRNRIMQAYQYQCAVCGFNVRVGDTLVTLEAAHIQWYQADGPDQEDNGLALCSLHHKLFDRGAFTVNNKMKIVVSEIVNGTQGFNDWVLAFHTKMISPPLRKTYYPKPKYLKWHENQVFKGRAREY